MFIPSNPYKWGDKNKQYKQTEKDAAKKKKSSFSEFSDISKEVIESVDLKDEVSLK